MTNPPKRPIKRLLIANRGEIATRILHTAQEMSIETYTLHTANDTSHALSSANSILLPSPNTYLSIPHLIRIAQTHHIDAIHPGYGFLSESTEFAHRMLTEANAVVIGPGPEILARTGDKLQARRLAEECGVPVLPALQTPTNDIAVLCTFANEIGYPVIIKAVDGGGGRGIRIVRREEDLASLAKLALNESPSKMAFAEKAAVDGFRHVEVQILGDGTGDVLHLWERECSIQRRFQKVVEFAPSSINDRALVEKVIESAVRMAKRVRYLGLGTWEFLVREGVGCGGQREGEFYFLEINPRIQVEHTVTESIVPSVDLVRCQLLLAQGVLLSDLPIPRDILLANSYTNDNYKHTTNVALPPPLYAIQLRLTAEDASNSFTLSVGRIASLCFPSGHGVRVDTHLVPPSLSPSSPPILIGADFDPLLAKIIVVAPVWDVVVAKARRALSETRVEGLKTNLDLLRGIVGSREFEVERRCNTRWLEGSLANLLEVGRSLSGEVEKKGIAMPKKEDTASKMGMGNANGSLLLRKGDKWTIELTPGSEAGKPTERQDTKNSTQPETTRSHLQLTQVRRNDFPNSFSASILYTSPSSSKPIPYTLNLHSSNSTSPNTFSSSSRHSQKQTDSTNRNTNKSQTQIPFPMAGKLVEILVQKGDVVREGDPLAVVRQMKMELEIRVPKGGGGSVVWIFGGAGVGDGEGEEEGDEGEEESDGATEVRRDLGDVEQGMLCCILERLEKERKGGGAKL